jgi:hypothetical protein
MEYEPGVYAAMVLFDTGLWFDAVVRGLMAEIGMGPTEAVRATSLAEAVRADRLGLHSV